MCEMKHPRRRLYSHRNNTSRLRFRTASMGLLLCLRCLVPRCLRKLTMGFPQYEPKWTQSASTCARAVALKSTLEASIVMPASLAQQCARCAQCVALERYNTVDGVKSGGKA
jgi:hypothetical protein